VLWGSSARSGRDGAAGDPCRPTDPRSGGGVCRETVEGSAPPAGHPPPLSRDSDYKLRTGTARYAAAPFASPNSPPGNVPVLPGGELCRRPHASTSPQTRTRALNWSSSSVSSGTAMRIYLRNPSGPQLADPHARIGGGGGGGRSSRRGMGRCRTFGAAPLNGEGRVWGWVAFGPDGWGAVSALWPIHSAARGANDSPFPCPGQPSAGQIPKLVRRLRPPRISRWRRPDRRWALTSRSPKIGPRSGDFSLTGRRASRRPRHGHLCRERFPSSNTVDAAWSLDARPWRPEPSASCSVHCRTVRNDA